MGHFVHKAKSDGQPRFDWENISACVSFCMERGVIPKVVLRDGGRARSSPSHLRKFILSIPPVDGIKDADDLAVIRYSMVRNSTLYRLIRLCLVVWPSCHVFPLFFQFLYLKSHGSREWFSLSEMDHK